MPRNYVRKSNRQNWNEESMDLAIQAVLKGARIASAARLFGVPRNTLKRRAFGENKMYNGASKGVLGRYKTCLPAELELQLRDYILDKKSRLSGLTMKEVCKMAYQLAEKNNCSHQFNSEKSVAGKEWFHGFVKRNPGLSICFPEAASDSRERDESQKEINTLGQASSQLTVDTNYENNAIRVKIEPNSGKTLEQDEVAVENTEQGLSSFLGIQMLIPKEELPESSTSGDLLNGPVDSHSLEDTITDTETAGNSLLLPDETLTAKETEKRSSRNRKLPTQKRKRTNFTLEQKKEIIDAATKEPNQSELARMFTKKWGFDVKRTAVISILNSKRSIEAALDSGFPVKRMQLKRRLHPRLDEAALMCLKQARSQNEPVDKHFLREKTVKLAELPRIENFKGSPCWAENFKERNDISFKTVQGEAGTALSLAEWQCRILRPLLEQFSPDDVFNLDETGLFWKLLPNKKSVEQITLLVGANMSGTEKLPLLAIGKSKNPRCFKNKEIPVKYIANKKACMTSDIFEDTLKSWDKELGQDNRKVLVFLDDCSAHPRSIKLDNIRTVFFPKNTNAKSQPMDRGIIDNLKRNYKKILLSFRMASIYGNNNFKLDLLDSLHFLRDAWDQVTGFTVKNCFAKSKFAEEEAETETEDAELVALWGALPIGLRMRDGEEMKLSEFLEVDENFANDGTFTLEEIAEDVFRREDSEVSGDEELTLDEKMIMAEEAKSALNTVRHFLEKNRGNAVAMKLCDQLDGEMRKFCQADGNGEI